MEMGALSAGQAASNAAAAAAALEAGISAYGAEDGQLWLQLYRLARDVRGAAAAAARVPSPAEVARRAHKSLTAPGAAVAFAAELKQLD